MITGAHVMIYSKDADADRAMLRDALELPNVDVGHGWLIFKLPPAEMATHPTDGEEWHALYLMCDDLDAAIAKLATKGVSCSVPAMQGWGRSTNIAMPGGGKLGLYEPRHARP